VIMSAPYNSGGHKARRGSSQVDLFSLSLSYFVVLVA